MKMQPGRTWEARPALRQRSRPAFGQRRTCGRALVVVRGRESRPHGEGGQSDGSGTKRTTPEAGCMNPTRMAEKPMFPTHRSNPSDGEPDAVKVARPVRRGGWRKPAGAVRPSAAPSLPNAWLGKPSHHLGRGGAGERAASAFSPVERAGLRHCPRTRPHGGRR